MKVSCGILHNNFLVSRWRDLTHSARRFCFPLPPNVVKLKSSFGLKSWKIDNLTENNEDINVSLTHFNELSFTLFRSRMGVSLNVQRGVFLQY